MVSRKPWILQVALFNRILPSGTILSLTVVALAINLIAAALMIFGVEQNRKILTVPWLSLQLNVLMFLIYSVASDPSLLYAILLVTCNVLWSIVLFYLLQDFYQRKPQDPYPPI